VPEKSLYAVERILVATNAGIVEFAGVLLRERMVTLTKID
jgi:hypothetical protein